REHLHAAVLIRHIDMTGAIGCDGAGPAEFPVAAAVRSPLREEDAGAGVFLNAMVRGVSDVDIAGTVGGHTNGAVRLPVAAAEAPLREQCAIASEFPDLLAASVRNVDVSSSVRGQGHVPGKRPTPLCEVGTTVREFLDAVIVGVQDVDVARRVSRDAKRVHELPFAAAVGAPLRDEGAGAGELLDALVVLVHHAHAAG